MNSEGGWPQPHRNCASNTSIPQTHGWAKSRMLTLLPWPHSAYHSCCRIRSCQSRHLKLYAIYGHWGCSKIRRRNTRKRYCSGLLPDRTNRNLTNPDGSYTACGEAVIRQTPYGRMGRMKNCAGTIQYLISDASNFVTGTVAVVDGGFNAFAM